ncbi:MAG: hypothetical protein VX834_04790 [Myxococcota bacterium]|nr:hypothetical protein [Myxococcota bacterium]
MNNAADDLDIKPLPGPIRRNLPLMGIVALAFIVGPLFNNLLDQYRMIVLDQRGELMFVARGSQQPPEWIEAVDAKPGAILAKGLGEWSPVVVEPIAEDAYILELYGRYTANWQGRVTHIARRSNPQSAETAVVELVGGGEMRFPIWADHLAMLKKGSLLRKVAGEWDPVIIDENEPLPAGFEMNPVEAEADDKEKAEAGESSPAP